VTTPCEYVDSHEANPPATAQLRRDWHCPVQSVAAMQQLVERQVRHSGFEALSRLPALPQLPASPWSPASSIASPLSPPLPPPPPPPPPELEGAHDASCIAVQPSSTGAPDVLDEHAVVPAHSASAADASAAVATHSSRLPRLGILVVIVVVVAGLTRQV
jgi:hypothetical protein